MSTFEESVRRTVRLGLFHALGQQIVDAERPGEKVRDIVISTNTAAPKTEKKAVYTVMVELSKGHISETMNISPTQFDTLEEALDGLYRASYRDVQFADSQGFKPLVYFVKQHEVNA